MAAVGEPATEREGGDLETGPAKVPVLHGREIIGLRHGERGNNEGQLSSMACREGKRNLGETTSYARGPHELKYRLGGGKSGARPGSCSRYRHRAGTWQAACVVRRNARIAKWPCLIYNYPGSSRCDDCDPSALTSSPLRAGVWRRLPAARPSRSPLHRRPRPPLCFVLVWRGPAAPAPITAAWLGAVELRF